MSNEKEQSKNHQNAAVKFFNKYLRPIKLIFIEVLAVVIITFTPLNPSKLPETDDKPTVVNGHILEPEISVNETDIYIDGYTQEHRLNPKSKVRVYQIKIDDDNIDIPKNQQ